jgi:uncharacterized membrane protein YphA (DoxX/SURF4 family)
LIGYSIGAKGLRSILPGSPRYSLGIVVGWVFMWSGWGKLHNLPAMIGNIRGWGIPFPQLLTPFVSGVEFFGGIFPLLGLMTRISAGALGVTMIVADVAIYPWIVPWEMQQQNLEDFPALKRRFEAIASRPSSIRAYARKDEFTRTPVVNDESRNILFGQTAQSLLSNT